MSGKQVPVAPPWVRRHAWIVGLIGAYAVALAAGTATREVAVAWLVVPVAALTAPALVSALPGRSAVGAAGASAGALVIQTIYAIVVFGDAILAPVVVATALCVIALYEVGCVLAVAFGVLSLAMLLIAGLEPSLLGLSSAEPGAFWTSVLTALAAGVVAAATITLFWRDRRRAVHVADQQRLATEAYLRVAGTLVIVLDRHGIVTVANRQTCLTLGLPEDEIVGREWFELVLPDEFRDDARRLFLASFEQYRRFSQLIKEPNDYENEVITRDRSRRRVQWWATFVTDVAGQPTGMVCSGTDITDARAASAALERNRLELDALRRLAQQVASLDDSRQAVVDGALALTGAAVVGIMEPDRTRSQLTITVSTEPRLVGHTVSLGREASIAGTAFLGGQPEFRCEVAASPEANRKLAAQVGVVSALHQPIVGADGTVGILTVGWDHEVPSLQERKAELVGLVAHEASIALRRRESLAQLERAALIDPLTGIANRRAFDAELPVALRRAEEDDYPVALVVIDLNEFKAVNDVLGHEAGDHLLIEVSAGWAGALRGGDLLARIGGDEFAVLLPTCDEHEMHHIIERLHRATQHGPGASIGGALWDRHETVSSLIRRADRSQYDDKARARRCPDAEPHPEPAPAPAPTAVVSVAPATSGGAAPPAGPVA